MAASMAASSSSSLAALAVVVVATLAVIGGARGDLASDRAECSDKLVGLATCLTYVQDQAAAPTPDCCSGLRQVLQTSRKCLCVLIKDRDDPNLGFKINVTKALGLPAFCNAPANISDCPRLLNLPPNSKEAQIFEQYGKQQAAQSTPSGGPNSASTGSTGTQKNGADGPTKKWFGVGKVGEAACTVFFFYSVSLLVSFFLVIG